MNFKNIIINREFDICVIKKTWIDDRITSDSLSIEGYYFFTSSVVEETCKEVA